MHRNIRTLVVWKIIFSHYINSIVVFSYLIIFFNDSLFVFINKVKKYIYIIRIFIILFLCLTHNNFFFLFQISELTHRLTFAPRNERNNILVVKVSYFLFLYFIFLIRNRLFAIVDQFIFCHSRNFKMWSL